MYTKYIKSRDSPVSVYLSCLILKKRKKFNLNKSIDVYTLYEA